MEISDPTGAPLKIETLKSPGGEDRITFLPNQTGPHKVNVKVAGFQIPGVWLQFVCLRIYYTSLFAFKERSEL